MKKGRKNSGSKGEEAGFEQRLNAFLSSPLASKASRGMSDRISIALHLENETFFFHKKKGINTLSRVEESRPDVHFWVPKNTARHLLALGELPGTGIGTIGVAIFERIFTADESIKIKFRVDAGFLSLWGKGYFSVLKAGGPEVASYLARFGFDSLSRVREVLKSIRS
ncbi:MAG: hypothetical protein KDD70_18765 [Bdellovibrionales bacterium]|nr:hypothetical protein [Bdellovibrionales bacterium]